MLWWFTTLVLKQWFKYPKKQVGPRGPRVSHHEFRNTLIILLGCIILTSQNNYDLVTKVTKLNIKLIWETDVENVHVHFQNNVISLKGCIMLTSQSELDLVSKVTKVTERSTVNAIEILMWRMLTLYLKHCD